MLRIAIHERPHETRFMVEGRLVGVWVSALEKCWEIALAAEPFKAVLVTLSLSAMDRKGRDLLIRMRRRGVGLESDGILMEAIIAGIEDKVETEEIAYASNGGRPIRGQYEDQLETKPVH